MKNFYINNNVFLNKKNCHKRCYYNNFIKNKIMFICSKEYRYFLNKENVIGVGLGYKTIKGITCQRYCIKVFVVNKIPRNSIRQEDLIPSIYRGISTDVVESGRMASQSLTKRIRPVLGGYGISPAGIEGTGTMGGVVTDGHDKFILSCNHVLADENRLSLGTPILQPSKTYGGKSPQDAIARLSKVVPLKFNGKTNFVDCAMAKITDLNMVSPKLYSIGEIKGYALVKVDEKVEKVGCITGVTKGRITAIGATMEIDMETGTAIFINQIITTPLSENGDSGSLLLNSKHELLGLICGGSKHQTIANLIDNVVDELGVEIVEK